jgi:hypothetical protein
MLKAAYAAAKAADPAAIVIAGGGAGAPVKDAPWWQEAIKAGIFAHCDAVSYHGYGYATTQILAGPKPLVDYVQWMNAQMRAQIGRTLPIWDTEVGVGPPTASHKYWWPQRGVGSPTEAARESVVCLLGEHAVGVSKTFFYDAFPLVLYEDGALQMFADVNGQLSPVGVALAVALAQTQGLVCDKIETPAENATLLAFRSPASAQKAKHVWVAYTLGEDRSFTVTIPAQAKVSVLSMYGHAGKFARHANQVTVTAGPLPVYVVAE